MLSRKPKTERDRFSLVQAGMCDALLDVPAGAQTTWYEIAKRALGPCGPRGRIRVANEWYALVKKIQFLLAMQMSGRESTDPRTRKIVCTLVEQRISDCAQLRARIRGKGKNTATVIEQTMTVERSAPMPRQEDRPIVRSDWDERMRVSIAQQLKRKDGLVTADQTPQCPPHLWQCVTIHRGPRACRLEHCEKECGVPDRLVDLDEEVRRIKERRSIRVA